MPFSIRLDQAMVNKLTSVAVRTHRRMSDVVREALELYVAGHEPEEDVVKPYERMAHLIGRVDSKGTVRSVDTGRKFTVLLQERRRARRAH